MKPSRPFSETTQKMLKDPKLAALSLEACLKDGDMELFTATLKDVADACGDLTSLSGHAEATLNCRVSKRITGHIHTKGPIVPLSS